VTTRNNSQHSIGREGIPSEATIHHALYIAAVEVDGIDALIKIRSQPQAVGLDCEPWQIVDSAFVLIQCMEEA